VTVIDHETYAGDARINDVPAGEQRLLSFGVDLQLTVDVTQDDHVDRLMTGRIVKGVLELETRQRYTRAYLARNGSAHDKTLVIEHPRRPGFQLVDTQKPVELLPNLYRFQGVVPANKVATLTVREEFTSSSAVALLGADTGPLLAYARSADIPRAVRDALERAVQLRQALSETERQINDRNQQLAQITQEQARIREDMKTVAASTPYYSRLLAKLNDQESAIEKLQREREELIDRRDSQRHDLDEYLSNLEVA